jgi:hypothetical protein
MVRPAARRDSFHCVDDIIHEIRDQVFAARHRLSRG